MNKQQAKEISAKWNIPLDRDFHSLDTDTVQRICEVIKVRKYYQRKGAPGSPARTYHQALVRASNFKTLEYITQMKTVQGWEDVDFETTSVRARRAIRDYRENDPTTDYRLIKRRS